jgi:hypothetical protein
MNRSSFRILSLALLALVMGFAVSCSDDEPALPDNTVSFGTSTLGFPDEDTEATVTVGLNRAVDTDKTITVLLTPAGVEYGTDFTTNPAAAAGVITLVVPEGSREVSFKVVKQEGILLDGDESIAFTIQSADEPLVLSDNKQLTLSFSAIVSEGSEMQLNGLIAAEAGTSAGNSVFVDFSANEQYPVARTSWDLGFYSGDDFRVILNNTKGSSAIMINETDLANVTSEDVDAADLAIGGGMGSFDAYDSINGELEYTAIDEISATAEDNKVYVINRVGGTGTTQPVEEFIKVRITRNGTTGYTVEYGLINATTFQTVNIDKNTLTNFSYLNFDSGAVIVEPAKDRWDIEWSWSIFWTMSGEDNVPYAFSDLVFINHHNGVKADTVFTADVTYDAFTETDLDNYELVSERNVIGSGWRATTPTAGVRTDRFYIVEDSHGNVYKLKFVSFHANDGGTRGKPEIEYALVKRGDD